VKAEIGNDMVIVKLIPYGVPPHTITVILPTTWSKIAYIFPSPYTSNELLFGFEIEAYSGNTGVIYIDCIHLHAQINARVQEEVEVGDWRLKIRNDEKLANLDVLLSTRASESSLTRVQEQVVTEDFRLKIRNDEYLSKLGLLEQLTKTYPWKEFTVDAAAAGDYEIISAIADKAIKVVFSEYESFEDIEVGLRFGDGTTFTDKFARRGTKGVMVQSRIGANLKGDVGYGLYLRTEGAVKVIGSISYEYV